MTTAKNGDLGTSSYDEHEFGATWWLDRAQDAAHSRAYKRVAEIAAEYAPKKKIQRVLDYACGPGLLIRYLLKTFPQAEVLGLDESESCLNAIPQVLTRARLGAAKERALPTQVQLPAKEPLPSAQVGVFCFPDFRGAENTSRLRLLRKRYPQEWEAAKRFSKWMKGYNKEIVMPDASEMFLKRLAHLDLEQAVGKGGLVLRVDYANCERSECEDVYDLAMRQYEGSLRTKDIPEELHDIIQPTTKIVFTEYRRSGVMSDVYAQSGDIDDLHGGYLISALRVL